MKLTPGVFENWPFSVLPVILPKKICEIVRRSAQKLGAMYKKLTSERYVKYIYKSEESFPFSGSNCPYTKSFFFEDFLCFYRLNRRGRIFSFCVSLIKLFEGGIITVFISESLDKTEEKLGQHFT